VALIEDIILVVIDNKDIRAIILTANEEEWRNILRAYHISYKGNFKDNFYLHHVINGNGYLK